MWKITISSQFTKNMVINVFQNVAKIGNLKKYVKYVCKSPCYSKKSKFNNEETGVGYIFRKPEKLTRNQILVAKSNNSLMKKF